MPIQPYEGYTTGSSSGGASSLNMKSASVSVSTPISATDNGKVITTTAQGITLTLAALSTLGDGFTLVVKNTSSGNVTIATTGADTIDGGASFVVPSKEVAFIQSDGTLAQVVSLSNLKMARLPIYQDNGSWNAASVLEAPVVEELGSVRDPVANLCLCNGVYIATCTYPVVYLFTSPDLVTWTTRTVGASSGNKRVVSNGSSAMCIDIGTTRAYLTSNGTTWTACTALPVASLAGIGILPAYINGLWVVVTSYTTYYTTPDGVTWTARTFPATLSSAIILGLGTSISKLWCFTGGASTAAYVTTDGINWTSAPLPFNASLFTASPSVQEDGSLLWDYNKTSIYKSADGVTWVDTGIKLPTSATAYRTAILGGCYCSYAAAGIYTYSNGVWTLRSADSPAAYLFSSGNPQVNVFSGQYSFQRGGNYVAASTQIQSYKVGTPGPYGLFVK